MEMLRHDYKTNHHELIAPPNLLQTLEKQVATATGSEQWLPTIAAGSDEVQISTAVEALETCGHAYTLRGRRYRNL
jgi:hypothetical protein